MRPNYEIKKLIKNLKLTPSAGLDSKVHSAIDEALEEKKRIESARYKPGIGRIIMRNPFTKLAAAAIILVAAGLAVYYFAGGGTKHCCAWEDIVRPIMEANTAELDIVVGDENTAPLIHDMIMGSKIRRTMEGIDNSVTILDLSSWKILTLETDKKKATFIDLKGLPQMPNYLDQLKGVIKMLQASPDFAVKDLGEQSFDGQLLHGFEAKHPQVSIKIFADPETALPVRIEQAGGQMFIICKNMQFDVPMDESIFDMNVPEGYKVEQRQLDLLGSTEQDFIDGLRVQAEVLGDGVFPDDVSVEYFIKMAATIKEKFDKLTAPDEEKTQLGMKLQKGLMFIRFFKGQGKWYYAGKGVKLGDADTAIFWYRPAGSQTYHVVYGDLSVEDVNEQDLPRPIEKEQAKEPLDTQKEFAGIQEDQWHITASGQVEAHIRLQITKTPADAAVMTVTLPYADAALASAKLGDLPLAFSKSQWARRYDVNIPPEKINAGPAEINFVWSMPVDKLKKTSDGYGTNLVSLLPVTSYKLTIVLEPACGYVFSFDHSKQQLTVFSWDTVGEKSTEPKTFFGSWGSLSPKPADN